VSAAARDGRHGLRRGFPAGRAALVVYVMAGYPDRAGSLESLRAVAASGADVIELGVPYGDPLADGPVIAGAGHAALMQPGGFGLTEALELAGEFTSTTPGAPPVAVMTYVNPMLRLSFAGVAERAAEADVAGFIIPDLPPDNPMAARWLHEARDQGLDTVFLAAPTSTPQRLRTVAEASSGFIYCVSSVGITGERARMRGDLVEFVDRVRGLRACNADPSIPLAVGFGIATREQAAEVARIADGVVVGSAVVKRQEDPTRVADIVAGLASAVRGARC
jgi:tryptophan synthase alpha chain